jgi:cysteine desulfuration protein SufE
MTASIDTITENFGFLDDWDDRYRYLIELGKDLPVLSDADMSEDNRVRGCASQVWVVTEIDRAGAEPVLHFKGQSDAHIVKGLVALILAFYSGHSARDILTRDALAFFRELGLADHLTPQRSNGVRAMVERIRRDAKNAVHG